jgi:hypothetical protein
MKLTGENRRTRGGGGEPVLVPLCPPQIQHGLTRDRTRASAVGGRRLTAEPWHGLCIGITNGSNYRATCFDKDEGIFRPFHNIKILQLLVSLYVPRLVD